MGVFEMVVALVFIGTVGKTIQSFVERAPASGADSTRVRQLEAALNATETRLEHTEHRLAELNEKFVFMERLLAPPAEDRAARAPNRAPPSQT